MEKNNGYFDDTEDLKALIDDIDEATESLDEEVNQLNRKIEIEKPVEDEIHINDIDDDFKDVLRRRKIRRMENNEPLSRVARKRKLKKWVYFLFAGIVLLIGLGTFLIIQNNNEKKRLAEEKAIIDNIKSHYYTHAKASKDAPIYEKKDNEYKEIGTIYKDANFELEDEVIKLDTKYFHIKDLDYYISFEDVTKGSEEKKNERYKNYLPFNINIVTKEKFTIYNDKDKYITLNKEMEFPVIINNYENKYYVVYNDMLVNISKDDVSKTKENKNTDKKNQSKMTTLAYHQVCEATDKCTDPYVSIKKDVFDKQMKYLKDNNYFTLNMDEMYMYLKGYLQVEKGVTITLDDGYLFKAADEVLDKYGLNATMFVATGAYSDYEQFKGLKAIESQSHTHNMHRNYVCPGGNQGGAILCSSKSTIVADLKKSIEVLGVEPKGMAYPFYDFNENAIAAVKEAGFKMAFVGRAGVMGRATPKVTDLYKIPRMTVWEESVMSYSSWKSYL